jgi:hypothetical protein
MTRWTNEDFEQLSWHDNHVHGMLFTKGSTESVD